MFQRGPRRLRLGADVAGAQADQSVHRVCSMAWAIPAGAAGDGEQREGRRWAGAEPRRLRRARNRHWARGQLPSGRRSVGRSAAAAVRNAPGSPSRADRPYRDGGRSPAGRDPLSTIGDRGLPDPGAPGSAAKLRTASVTPPWRGPLSVANPASAEAARDAPVEAATRTAKAEALSSWSATSTRMRRTRSRPDRRNPGPRPGQAAVDQPAADLARHRVGQDVEQGRGLDRQRRGRAAHALMDDGRPRAQHAR